MIRALVNLHQGNIRGLKVLILGFSFKENCSDTRNTKVADLYHALTDAGLDVYVQDPWVRKEEHPDIRFIEEGLELNLSAMIVAVKHDVFQQIDFLSLDEKGVAIFDTQDIVSRDLVSLRL